MKVQPNLLQERTEDFYKDSPLRASDEDYLAWDRDAVLDKSLINNIMQRDIQERSKEEQELFEVSYKIFSK